MSLSDQSKDEFQPLAVTALDSFSEEIEQRENAEPDFDRFKLLFEPGPFQKKDAGDDFELMWDPDNGEEEVSVFEPLFETREEKRAREAALENEKKAKSPDEEPVNEIPDPTPEELGFQEGYEKGQALGIAEGSEKGYAEGFEKGQTEGFEKGLEEGQALGREQGHEEGLQSGREAGEAETAEKAGALLEQLSGILTEADQTLEKIVDVYEDRLIGLIQEIARKVIMAKVETDDEIVRPMILDALKTLVAPEEIVLSVAIEDYEYVEMIKDDFFEQVDSLTSISVQSDASIARGGFRIETRTGEITSDIQDRLEAVFEAVKNERKG